MSRHRLSTIVVASILAVGPAAACHEAAHVVAGRLAGGTPTFMTATEVLGDFHSLSPWGFVALGGAGFVVNLVFCLLGLIALTRRRASPVFRLTAWFFFGVNGMIVCTAMLGESLAAYGDWMTILAPFGATLPMRLGFGLLGLAGIALMVRRSGAALAALIPRGDVAWRLTEARRILGIGVLASAALLLGASVASPAGVTRASLLALGAVLGAFVPLAFGARFVPRIPSLVDDASAPAGVFWAMAATAVTLVLWLVVGPGIRAPAGFF